MLVALPFPSRSYAFFQTSGTDSAWFPSLAIPTSYFPLMATPLWDVHLPSEMPQKSYHSIIRPSLKSTELTISHLLWIPFKSSSASATQLFWTPINLFQTIGYVLCLILETRLLTEALTLPSFATGVHRLLTPQRVQRLQTPWSRLTCTLV